MHKPVSAGDISKLHNEVNLYINQRLVITTTAITIFGVVAGLVAPGTSTGGNTEVRSLSLILPAVLMIIFAIMLWYCQSVLQQIHVISTYLVETQSSAWEDHYHCFNNHPLNKRINLKSSVDKIPLYVFATLGISSVFLSTLMYVIASTKYATSSENEFTLKLSVVAFIIASVIYLIVFIRFWRKRDPKESRKRARKLWRKVLDEQAEEDLSSVRVLARLSEASFRAVWENTDDDIYNEL